ncbi:hypothetical protein Ao3042_02878 [Aspergillus oryzae 3.042]|uniref:Uncharacterized protein n=1 Tax=Aspergillus oryzae (strain 3.042) TaxID=1160506 RepID=I8U152_ASPO3|nr:hypothetical protein Ao3042_02878 [Aspergillus oryzae 3.042]|eukprot:EIT80465.1 hypothetical protein Ao3042_02878 [Aspergillus oryzae 3.042]
MSQYRNGGFISLLTRNGLACLGKKGRLHYVHVNPDGRQESDGDADDDDDVEESLPDATGSNNSPSPSSMIWRKGQKPHSLPASTSTNTSHNHQGERLGQSHRDSRHYSISSFNAVADSNETSPQSASYYAQTSAYECLSQPTDQPSNAFPAERDHYRLGPLKGVPETFSDASYTSDLQEACLIRYFVEKLAHWTDTSRSQSPYTPKTTTPSTPPKQSTAQRTTPTSTPRPQSPSATPPASSPSGKKSGAHSCTNDPSGSPSPQRTTTTPSPQPATSSGPTASWSATQTPNTRRKHPGSKNGIVSRPSKHTGITINLFRINRFTMYHRNRRRGLISRLSGL